MYSIQFLLTYVIEILTPIQYHFVFRLQSLRLQDLCFFVA